MLSYYLNATVHEAPDKGSRLSKHMPESEIPAWVVEMFQKENLRSLNISWEDGGQLIVGRGLPRPAIVRAGIDTTMMRDSALRAAAEFVNKAVYVASDDPEDMEETVNWLGDFATALMFELGEYSNEEGGMESALDYLEWLTTNVHSLYEMRSDAQDS